MTLVMRMFGDCEFCGNPARVRQLVFANCHFEINGCAI
jgi:hypothetical protein